MDLFHSFLRDSSVLETDECEALASARLPIATDIYPRNPTEVAEQIAQIVLLSILRNIGDTESREVVAIGTSTAHSFASSPTCATH